jgi:hypothetical protein
LNIPNKIVDPNMDLWFVDMSGINECFGAGIYGPRHIHRESIHLDNLFTVFLAKVMAILRCVELLVKNMTMRRIHISSEEVVQL